VIFANIDGRFQNFIEVEVGGSKRREAELACEAAAAVLLTSVPPIKFFGETTPATLAGFCTDSEIVINAGLPSIRDIKNTVRHEMWHWAESQKPMSERRSRTSEERRAQFFEWSWNDYQTGISLFFYSRAPIANICKKS
jgi:hypothetical protein